MNQIFADSIARSKSYYDGFEDVIHDLSHSQRVAQNAKDIAKSLGYDNFELLEVCALWHDAARTVNKEPHEEAGAVMARDDLLARGASPEVANLAYEGIRFHKSTANPQTIEGKIIRDADKLDIFSVVRYQKCNDAGWTQEYKDDFKKTYENISRYPDVFTYDYTKELYKERLPKFLEFYESVKHKLD